MPEKLDLFSKLHFGKYFQMSAKKHLLTLLVFLTYTILLFPNPSYSQTATSVTTTSFSPMILDVTLNDQNLQQAALFFKNGDELYVRQSDIQKWRMFIPKTPPIIYLSEAFYPLSDFVGTTYTINQQQETINIMFPAMYFKHSDYTPITENLVTPKRPIPGAYFDYDVVGQNASTGDSTNGYFFVNDFGPYGSISSDFAAQENMHMFWQQVPTPNVLPQQDTFVRLNTTYDYDQPDDVRSIRFGDSYSDAGMWSQSVGFGGVQIATNFTTQPNFITFPMPSISGNAVVPSLANLYVNNALVSQKNLPAGPFTINQVPVVTGNGTVNVVTTNILGQQQVMSIPYYASDNLLKPGLQNYSYEMGFIRQNFDVDSNDYGQFMAVGTDQVGITDDFTAQWHAELLAQQQTAGVGGSYLLGSLGVFSLAGAASRDSDGEGGLGQIGFQRQANGTGIRFGGSTQFTTSKFTDIGYDMESTAPLMNTSQAFIGLPLRGGASIGVAYVAQKYAGDPFYNFVSGSYTYTIHHTWALSLTGLSNVSGPDNKEVMLSLSRSLGANHFMSLNGQGEQGNNQGNVGFSKNLPLGTGYGYQLQAGGGEQSSNYLANLYAQNNVGSYSFSAANQYGETGEQIGASGSVVLMDSHLFLSRNIGNGFAVVDVPGYSNVTVYQSNQPVAKTNSAGLALVPQLLPYQNNGISIEPKDLPFNAQIGKTTLNAIPYYNSGVFLKFPVYPANGGLFTLMTPSNQPLPEGTSVHIIGETKTFTVVDDGEVYVMGFYPGNNQIEANFNGQQCVATINYKPSSLAYQQLGSVICQ